MNYKIIYQIGFLLLLGNTTGFAQQNSTPIIEADVRTMEEKYPNVFTTAKFNHPDTAFEIGKKIDGFINDFPGENGKSQFYLIYAQHLQKLNQTDLATQYRSSFIQLFQSINRVNQLVDNKVGYYESMQSMLVAHAEYALVEISQADQSKYKNLDVSKQKKLFIKSIEQKIKTRNQQLNLNSLPNYSKNQEIIKRELSKIEQLIVDTYTLKVAQVFHYTYY